MAPFPVVDLAEKLSVRQLAARSTNGSIILPTWMPGNITLREIYYLESYALLVYGDHVPAHHIDGDVGIEITYLGDHAPTLDEIRSRNPERLERVGDLWVVIDEEAAPGPTWKERGIEPILADFSYGGYCYMVTGRKEKITRDDLIRIIEGMKPLGNDTMRKQQPNGVA